MVTAFLIILLIVAFGVLAWAGAKIERLQDLVENLRIDRHEDDLSRFVEAVQKAEAIRTLRAAARDWDSPKEQVNLQRLAREKYVVGGPSMPEIWLTDRAANIKRELEEMA